MLFQIAEQGKLLQTSSIKCNEKAYEAAARAVDKHTDHLGIEGEPSVQIWHQLASLHEYCAMNGVDLDAQLADVRQKITSGDIQSPAWIDARRQSRGDRDTTPSV